MKNKITKFLTILSIIFISFFINQNKAEAGGACSWVVYQSRIDSNGHAINSFLDNKGSSNKTNMDDFYQVYIPSDNSYSNDTREIGKFNLYYSIQGADSNGHLNKQLYTRINNKWLKNYLKDNNYNCPLYIKVSKKGNDFTIDSATKDEYNSYIKSQYEGITYNPSTISSLALNSSNLYSNLEFKTMVFASREYSVNYNNSKNHNRLKNLTKSNGEKIDFDFEKFGLSTNFETIGSLAEQQFYKQTKDKWYSVLNSDSAQLEKCGDYFGTCRTAAIRIKSHAFYNWFRWVEDFILEDSFETYLKAYKYAHLYEYNSEKEYNAAVAVFDEVLNTSKYDSKLTDLKDNSCEVYCVDQNGKDENGKNNQSMAYEECKKGTPYKNCLSAYNACKGISSSSAQEQCMKGKLGNDEYNKFKSLNAEKRNEIIDKRDNSLESMQENMDVLTKTDPPLLNIEFEPYKITCDDVAIFHTFYVILEIMAPILVILFGTIDYAKAVMASDVEKMQKAKKNFPKRLGLLLLFIFVPLLVSFLIGEFSSTNSSLMYCIINGG